MSDFAKAVYAIVARIPSGATLTYKDVARRAGRPNAYRAVGSILNKNRDKTIPCHRVIRSDGGVGGYNSLRGVKTDILRREGAIL